MRIEIQDPSLEARLREQFKSTGANNVEDVLRHLLETQEEQDRWLVENKNVIQAKIRRGVEQLDAGQGIPEADLDSHLSKLKSNRG